MKNIQKSRKSIILILVLIFILLSACGGETITIVPEPTNTPEPPTVEADSSLSGADIYAGLCIACHGADAKGVPNLGKDLTTSEFVSSKSDEEVVAFIVEGRAADHPENTTGVAMPPNGGNPNLSEAEILTVVDYLRTLAAK